MSREKEDFLVKNVKKHKEHRRCTLSSAIAANLAKGYDLEASVQRAKEYIAFALGDMLNLGQGSGPMNHAPKYGSLPVVHNTGGLHDTVNMLNDDGTQGNGIVFCNYDSYALRWAVDEAMRFYHRPAEWKTGVISRIMVEARKRFNHDVTAQEYIKIYESLLSRPLVVD